MKKTPKIPHTFVIVFAMMVLCGILTWIVPAGEFVRTSATVNGSIREVIVPNSYHIVQQTPQSWQILGDFLRGFEKQAGIIAFIIVIGGAFQLLNSSKAIDYGIASFLKKSKKNTGPLVIIFSMLIFSLFGAVFGMSEETLAFVVIFVPLAVSMGYDSITGLLMVYVAAHVGFAGAIFNPFTIGIAQGLSGLPLFSGFQYRAVCWLILTAVIIIVALIYASKVKKNPKLSPMYKLDSSWREKAKVSQETSYDVKPQIASWVTFGIVSIALVLFSIFYPKSTMSVGGSSFSFAWIPLLTTVHIVVGAILLKSSKLSYILLILFLTIAFLIVGVLGHGWYMTEISALFLAMGLIAGFAVGSSANEVALDFIAGAKDILSTALIVGLAGGIIVVLDDGKIMDTILYSLANSIEGTGTAVATSLMYATQTFLNLFIPSGTAKAALTMPIMAPFSDVIGLSRQITVLAYQFGDGFTNMITPTSAVLMGALGIAKIPYQVWFKWFWKLLLGLMLLGLALLLIAVAFPVI